MSLAPPTADPPRLDDALVEFEAASLRLRAAWMAWTEGARAGSVETRIAVDAAALAAEQALDAVREAQRAVARFGTRS